MRSRTTWILALATMAIAWVLYGQPDPTGKDAAPTLLPVSPETITSIRIERPDESVLLVRKDSGWHIAEPIQAPADPQRVSILLRTLASPGETRPVGTAGGPLEPFGLAPPRTRIDLSSGSLKHPSIFLGGQAPIGGRAYLLLENEPDVLLVSDDIPFATDRGVADLRSRKVLSSAFVPEKVLFHRPNLPTMVLEKTQTGWQLLEPYQAPASPAAIEVWLEAVRSLEAQSFFDQPSVEDLEAYSFAPAPLEIEWRDPRGTHRLWIGGPNLRAGDDELWVRNDRTEALYSVPRRQIAAIDLAPEALRDKSLVEFDTAEIGAVSVERPVLPNLRLERDGPRWQAGKSALNPQKAEAYLRELLSISGEVTLSTASGLEHFGLDQPDFTITFEDTSGQLLARVLISQTTGTMAITREGHPRIYSLNSRNRSLLTRTPEDFR